jgi:hypothetical protein
MRAGQNAERAVSKSWMTATTSANRETVRPEGVAPQGDLPSNEAVPAWRVEAESDTMEEIDESDIDEEPYDLAGALSALGPEPETPPKEREPKPVSDEVMRFVGAFKLSMLGSTEGECNAALAAMRRLPNCKEVVEQIADAVARGLGDPGRGWGLVQYLRDIANAAYARTEWWQKRCETHERALEIRYKSPDAAKKNHDIMQKISTAPAV